MMRALRRYFRSPARRYAIATITGALAQALSACSNAAATSPRTSAALRAASRRLTGIQQTYADETDDEAPTLAVSGMAAARAAGGPGAPSATQGQPGGGVATIGPQPTLATLPSNEPAGFQLLGARAFNSKASSLRDQAGAEGWATNEANAPQLTIVPDPTAPKSPGGVLQMLYPKGHRGGSSVGAFAKVFPSAQKEVYMSTYIKISANFQGHSSHTNKLFFFWMNGGARFFVSAEGGDYGPLNAQLRLQSTADPRTHFAANTAPTSQSELTRGVWHKMEVVVKMNTPGVADGHMQMWIDGVKTHDYTNVMMSGPTDPSDMSQFQAASVWGGTGNVVKRNQSISWDEIYVSGR